MTKNILLGAGVVLLGMIGTQQLMLNAHQLKVNRLVDECLDYHKTRFEDSLNKMDARERLEAVGSSCLTYR